MSHIDLLINALTTILVTIDPPGLAPIFLSLTVGMSRHERFLVARRGTLIAFFILSAFALFGNGILGLLGISIGAFRIAGGLLLFWIAFEMIFEKRNERKEKTGEAAITRDHIHNIAVFPLALPLIAGPGAISATILLSGSFSSTIDPGSADPGHRLLPCHPVCRPGDRRAHRPVSRRHRPRHPDPAAWRHPCGSGRAVRR